MAVSTAQMDLDGISSTGFLSFFPIKKYCNFGMPPIIRAKLGTVVLPQCRMARPECLFRMPPIIRSPGKGPWTWPFGVQRRVGNPTSPRFGPCPDRPKYITHVNERYSEELEPGSGEISYLHEQIRMIAGGEPFCKSSCISL